MKDNKTEESLEDVFDGVEDDLDDYCEKKSLATKIIVFGLIFAFIASSLVSI